MAKRRVDHVNRNGKDGVFRDLFSFAKYRFQLYRCLHPEDTKTTSRKIKNITLENVALRSFQNDLAFCVGDKLIALVEAQSTWSENIVLRFLPYLSNTIIGYLANKGISVFDAQRVILPRVELYVLYTGSKDAPPDGLTMTDQHFEGFPCDLEISVKIIRDGQPGDIINQYVGFTGVFNEQMRLHYDNKALAISETIRICRERKFLAEYMKRREIEVMNILDDRFQYELAMRNRDLENVRKGVKQGLEQGVKQGVKQGKEEQAIATAEKMLASGCDHGFVAEMNGLSLQRVTELANKINSEL